MRGKIFGDEIFGDLKDSMIKWTKHQQIKSEGTAPDPKLQNTTITPFQNWHCYVMAEMQLTLAISQCVKCRSLLHVQAGQNKLKEKHISGLKSTMKCC